MVNALLKDIDKSVQICDDVPVLDFLLGNDFQSQSATKSHPKN